MKRYILKRVLQLVPILFGITLLSFILMNVGTADVIDVMESSTGSALTEEEKQEAHRKLCREVLTNNVRTYQALKKYVREI